METIFDYDPTPEELRYLAGLDAESYRARVTADEALSGLSVLFALRGDEKLSDFYADQISDKALLQFTLQNGDLISPSRSAKRDSSAVKPSKAA